MKPKNLRHWMVHISHLSDVPVSRNWYKTVKLISKIHIYAILYKNWSIKQIIFNKYETNMKMTISHRNLKISGLRLLINFLFTYTHLNGSFGVGWCSPTQTWPVSSFALINSRSTPPGSSTTVELIN